MSLLFHYMCAYFQQCIIALTFRIVHLELHLLRGSRPSRLDDDYDDDEGGDGGGDDNCDLGDRDYDDDDGDVHGG